MLESIMTSPQKQEEGAMHPSLEILNQYLKAANDTPNHNQTPKECAISEWFTVKHIGEANYYRRSQQSLMSVILHYILLSM